MAQNSQSAGSAGDGPRRLKQLPCLAANLFTGFVPLCCTACLIHRSWAKPTAVVRWRLRERCKCWSAFSCALRYRRGGGEGAQMKKDSFWSQKKAGHVRLDISLSLSGACFSFLLLIEGRAEANLLSSAIRHIYLCCIFKYSKIIPV